MNFLPILQRPHVSIIFGTNRFIFSLKIKLNSIVDTSKSLVQLTNFNAFSMSLVSFTVGFIATIILLTCSEPP